MKSTYKISLIFICFNTWAITFLFTLFVIAVPWIGFSQKEPSKSTRYLAWQLGSQISLAALAYSSGFPRVDAEKMIHEVQPAADIFKVKIPPLPMKTNRKGEDIANIFRYLLHTLDDSIGKAISSSYPKDHLYLFEIAIKSYMLILVYPEGDEEAMAIKEVIQKRAPLAGIPTHIWKPVVIKVEAKAPHSEVKSAIIRMHDNVANFLDPFK